MTEGFLSRSHVEPIAKGDERVKEACGCGCGVEGVLKKAPMKDGKRHAQRVCKCPRCRGSRNRVNGQSAWRRGRKATGIPSPRFVGQGGNEENFSDHFRWECKAGAQAGPVATRFLKSEKQAEQNRAIGDGRPFAAMFVPEGWGGDCIVAMRGTVFNRYVRPALAQGGM